MEITGPAAAGCVFPPLPHQQHVVLDDEELLAPLSEPLPPPQVPTEPGLRRGPQTDLGGAPLDVVSSVLHKAASFILIILFLTIRLVVTAL